MKKQKLFQSLKCAFEGIKATVIYERNIKIHYMMALIAILLAFLLNFTCFEYAILVLLITIVICFEMVNTAIEKMVDLATDGHIHPLAKLAKDISAGAVLIAAFASIIIGLLLYGPKLINLIK